jgi:hypothetical protein
MEKEKIDTSVNPHAVNIVMQAVGCLQGRFMYSREEAIAEALKILSTPAPVRKGGNRSRYAPLPKAEPWKPCAPKPPQVIEQWGKR